MKVVLASGSPRRRELLKRIFDEYDVVSSSIDERSIEDRLENENQGINSILLAEKIVQSLSRAKAEDVFHNLNYPQDTLIIGADTTVALSDEILGKPKDRDDAVRMLRKESLEDQKVITGITLIYNGNIKTFSETSTVIFNKLDDEQEKRIQEYCDTKDPYDKAGAYGIQALGDKLVDSYQGEFENIVGLPVCRLKKELENFI